MNFFYSDPYGAERGEQLWELLAGVRLSSLESLFDSLLPRWDLEATRPKVHSHYHVRPTGHRDHIPSLETQQE